MDTLLVLFVGVVALAFLIQSVAMWRAFRAVKETAERFNVQSENIQKDILQIAEKLKNTADSLQPLGRMAEDMSGAFQELAGVVRGRTTDLDQFMQELVQVGRDQASKVDYVVTDTVRKFEETTEVIKRDILRPAIEISAFLRGLKSGVDFLFAKRPEQLRPREADEEPEV